MMKFILTFTFISFFHIASHGQANWTGRQLALSTVNGNVYFDIQFFKCGPYRVSGWPKVVIEHTFSSNASIEIKLKGRDCDGKIKSSNFSGSSISPNYRYLDGGNWHSFKEIIDIERVRVTYKYSGKTFQHIVDKERGINKTESW